MADAQAAQRGNEHKARNWRRWAIPGFLLAIAAASVGFVIAMPAEHKPVPPPEIPPVNVRAQEIKAIEELRDTFSLSAVIEPNLIVQVAAEVAGRVEHFGVRQQNLTWRGQTYPSGSAIDEGEPVQAGMTLVQLNRDLLQARFDQLEAQFDFDQREFERLLELHEAGATSTTELNDARTRRDVSRAALDELRKQLERTQINSPIDGILDQLLVEIGEYAAPGDPVARIVDVRKVKVVVDVPERDIHYLNTGDEALVEAYVPELRTFVGRITYISELAHPGSRTTRVEITVGNEGHSLRSGQIVQARLTRRILHDVIMIPLSAVIPLENGKVVYLDVAGKAVRRDVTLGFIKGREVRVREGLKPGDRLIIQGHRYVGPGQPVNVVERSQPPAGDDQ